MPLRYYQAEAIDSIFEYYQSGKVGNPVIGLPTGTGKSHIPAGFIQKALHYWPDQRFIVATHVKELVKQNASKLVKAWPNAPIGLHSSGLKQRDTTHPIIYGGIQSMIKNPQEFGRRDLMIIDEAHLVNSNAEGMYGKFIQEMKDINPLFKIVGMSATLYRMGQGMLTDGQIFTDTCYDMTDMYGFERLIAEGYLGMLVPQPTDASYDIENVAMSKYDFNLKQLQEAVDKEDKTREVLTELCRKGYNRNSWLIFAAGVRHANHVCDMLNSFGIPTVVVHSNTKDYKMSDKLRDHNIRLFKTGQVRCIVNNGILTTGFDHPPIDLIAMLRHTVSVPLWVQMLGRGTRPWLGGYVDANGEVTDDPIGISGPNTYFPGKPNTLVLDFARNTARLGPINDPKIPKRKRKGSEPGDAPIRICPTCNTYNHASATFCCLCGEIFERSPKLTEKASTGQLIKIEEPIVEVHDVDRVLYAKHQKGGNDPVLRVTYYCGFNKFPEWIPIQSKRAKWKAVDWWRTRHNSEMPETVEEALTYSSQFRVPKQVRVWVNREFPKVLSHVY